MGLIKKNAKGFNYKYADIAEVHSFLEDNGWDYYQYIEVVEGNDYIFTVPIIDGKEQPPRQGCRVVQATLKGVNNPAQEQGSALTYARRYSLLMAFGLATTDDDAACMSKPKEEKKEENKVEKLPVTKANVDALEKMIIEKKTDKAKLLEYYGVSEIAQMNQEQWLHAMKMLEKR